MTQDERWEQQYNALKNFIETHQRRPSKYEPKEKLAHHWWRHNLKLYTKGNFPSTASKSSNHLLNLPISTNERTSTNNF